MKLEDYVVERASENQIEDFIKRLPKLRRVNFIHLVFLQAKFIPWYYYVFAVFFLIRLAQTDLTNITGILNEIQMYVCLLFFTAVPEISKSITYEMAEIEKSCLNNLARLVFARLVVIYCQITLFCLLALVVTPIVTVVSIFEIALPVLVSLLLALLISMLIGKQDWISMCCSYFVTVALVLYVDNIIDAELILLVIGYLGVFIINYIVIFIQRKGFEHNEIDYRKNN